jgi:hypothetical protein
MTKQFNNSEKNNQLTDPNGYDVKNMMFSSAVAGAVKDTPITYKRINITTLNKDKSVGDLILGTTRLFSFGVSININAETKKPSGYTLPLCLWNKDGASKEEKAWTTTFTKIADHCKAYLLSNKDNDDLGLYDLEESSLKSFNPLYWKKDKGRIVEGTGPTLYVKLIESKKNNKFLSMFYNKNYEPLDPMTLIGKYCYVTACVKIESIFISSGKNPKITLQLKLYEAIVEMSENNMKPLIARPVPESKLVMDMSKLSMAKSDGSVENSDGEDIPVEEEEKPQPPPPKRNIKEVPRKAVKKDS